MKLPRNGKVVIFDDEIDKVGMLMTDLSRRAIPFTYYQDIEGKDLPESPLKNIRLVFLDLVLVSDQEAQSTQTINSSIFKRLYKVLGKENGPYILVIWSTQIENYEADFKTELAKDHNKCIQPIEIITLDKTKAISEPQTISDEVNKVVDSKSSLKALLVWESIINESAGEITNDFVNVIADGLDLNEGLDNLLFKLAYANLGEQIKKTESEDIVSGAYETLNHSLIHKIKSNIKDHGQDTLFEEKPKGVDYDCDFIGKINGQLHLENRNLDASCPGSFAFPLEFKQYKGEREVSRGKVLDLRYNVLISSLFDCGISGVSKLIKDNCKYVELNITPPCDYAQDKMGLCRILPGILVPHNHAETVITRKGDPDSPKRRLKEDATKSVLLHSLYTNSDYSYKSDFYINIEGINYYFVFNHSYMYALSVSKLVEITPVNRISTMFLNDIQSKLGGHIIRNGILYL